MHELPTLLPSRFSLERVLGEGGAGIVYEAWDREREIAVALKVLSRTTPNTIFRLKNEFRTLANMSHPNLVVLHDLMQHDDQWLLTMDLIRGVGFSSWVWRGALVRDAQTVDTPASPSSLADTYEDEAPPCGEGHGQVDVARLRDALSQLATAVTALHRAGFLHRDLKPSNVLVTDQGRVVVLDFGLVRDQDAMNQTLEERIVGTPAYMSPEQARGLPTTAASDWYGVGVMLYEALTGILPFEGTIMQVLASKQLRDPPDPREHRPDLPDDLAGLAVSLLARDPAARPTERAIASLIHGTPEVSTDEPPDKGAPPFEGRGHELGVLAAAARSASSGRTTLVRVSGPAGFGKTSLVRHHLDGLRRGGQAVVLAGRCYEREQVAYKALDSVVDALSRHLRSLPTSEVERLLPTNVEALAQAFPVLRRVATIKEATPEPRAAIEPRELRQQAFLSLRELLSDLAREQLLVLFIDDLHFGDADSAEGLYLLLGGTAPPPVLILGTHREDGFADSPLLRRLDAMAAQLPEVDVHHVQVGPLVPADAERLALALLGDGADPDLAHRIGEVSEGNPLLLGELARHARRHPKNVAHLSIHDVLAVRLSELPPSARTLLRVLSLMGRPVSPTLVGRVADLRNEAPRAFAALRATNLVRTGWQEGRETVEPHHEQVRDVALAQVSSEDIRRWHERLAQPLMKESSADPEQLAVHLEGAGRLEEATEKLTLAAELAARQLAFDRAAALYERVLRLQAQVPGTDDPGTAVALMSARAEALANAGRAVEAGEVYLQAAELAPALGALELRRLAAGHLLRSGHITQGLDLLEQVLASVNLSLPKSRASTLAALLVQRSRLKLHGLDYEERDASEIDAEALRRVDVAWTATTGLGMVDVIKSAQFQAQHLLLALQAGEPYRVARALSLEAAHLGWRGEGYRERTDALLDRARDIAERLRNPHALGLVDGARATAAYCRGDFRQAVSSAATADATFKKHCTNVSWERATVGRFLRESRYLLGEIGGRRNSAIDALADAEQRGDRFAGQIAASGFAVVEWILEDRTDEVRTRLETWVAHDEAGFLLHHAAFLRALTQLDLYDGEYPRAYERLSTFNEAVEDSLLLRVRVVRLLSLYDRCLAALMSAEHGKEHRLEEAESLARTLASLRLAPAKALSSYFLGLVSARRRRPDEALALLREAETGLAEVGMELHRIAALWARAQLLGGEEGNELEEVSRRFLEERGVRELDRFLATLGIRCD